MADTPSARSADAAPAPVGEPPAISVVIPTYNRCERLGRVLTALATQDVAQTFEVIVVSDGSTDGTDDYLRGGHTPLPVHALLGPNAGPAVARNHGVDAARGELIVFIDDDVVPNPGLLAAHWAAHRGHDRLVAIGPMLTPPDHDLTPWVAWEQAMLDRQYVALRSGKYPATARQFYTGNASMRREHLLAIGGFDPTLRRAEDVELAYRLAERGLRFVFHPEATGYHYAHRSYASWLAVAHSYGANDVSFARDRGQGWLLPTVRDKFAAYPAPIRWTLRWAATDGRRARAVTSTAGLLARALHRARLEAIGRGVLSVAYATEYYRGVHEQCGGGLAFERLLRTGELTESTSSESTSSGPTSSGPTP